MKETKVLPVYDPVIKGYIHHAVCFSMINLDNNDDNLWFSNNYIQLHCPKNLALNRNSQLDFCHETFYSVFDHFLTIQNLHKDIISKYYGGVLNFLIDRIDEQNYVELMVNDYYLPGTSSFMNKNLTHNIVVYGYDTKRMIFFVRYMKNQIFTDAQLDFKTLELSFNNTYETGDWSNYSKIYKKNRYNLTFDHTRFSGFLNDYFYSRNHFREADRVYGLSVYQYIIDYFNNLEDGLTSTDIRILHLLWEHKKSMTYKINYLMTNKIINFESDLVNQLRAIENEALLLRNFQLKCMIKPEREMFSKIKKKLSEMKEKEVSIYHNLINQI